MEWNWNVFAILRNMNNKLDTLSSLVQTLVKQGATMSAELDALAAQVKANTDAEASATIVINGIAAQIAAAVAAAASLNAADRAKLVSLTNNLQASVAPLAASIVQNTPAAPVSS